jgi:hypothetical protein
LVLVLEQKVYVIYTVIPPIHYQILCITDANKHKWERVLCHAHGNSPLSVITRPACGAGIQRLKSLYYRILPRILPNGPAFGCSNLIQFNFCPAKNRQEGRCYRVHWSLRLHIEEIYAKLHYMTILAN